MLVGLFAAAVALLCAHLTSAQQPAAKSDMQAAYVPSMTFEVATIRESDPNHSVRIPVRYSLHNSRVSLSDYGVLTLLWTAYGVEGYQVQGLPAWAHQAMFDIQAQSDPSADKKLAKLSDDQARLEHEHMFQVLLADRFHLKMHWETKNGLIYELIRAKNGPKLQPAGSLPISPRELAFMGKLKIPPIFAYGNSGYEGHRCSLDALADALTPDMGAPVINKTGLAETHDFILKYHGIRADEASDDPTLPPPLVDALTDQLGLKLQPGKGPQQYLVIDHIERPSAN